jgi:ABC-type dipeptide/oligopeptide/nickel transport system permease subunit
VAGRLAAPPPQPRGGGQRARRADRPRPVGVSAPGLAAPPRPGLFAVRPRARLASSPIRAPTPSCPPSSGAARARVDHGLPELDGSTITVELAIDAGDRPAHPALSSSAPTSSRHPRLDLGPGARRRRHPDAVERLHFLFGTDANGRDVAARIMIGVRISLAIGLLASFMALVIGVAYGAISGYLGGRVDNVMMRVVDILYSLPFIFFVIMLVVFFGRSIV